MDPLKKEKIATEIWNLELKYPSNGHMSEKFEAIDKIASKLTLEELFEIADYIEEKFAKIQIL